MELINKVANKIRKGLRSFLQITPASEFTVTINESVDHLSNCAKNRIWYWGKSKQLSSLYSQIDEPSTLFWKAIPTVGQEIRKIHIPLSALIVDTIANIVMDDYNGIEINDKNSTIHNERWQDIEQSNEFAEVLRECLTDIGIVGDGAFKISFDKSISDLPIIEWYPAERVQFVYKRGRIREIVFYTEYVHDFKKFFFTETYGYGYIMYKLYNSEKTEIPINSIPDTAWVDCKGYTHNDSYMWAVPVKLGKSNYKGRGKGLIDDKCESFDSLDEAWSQWMDALRAGRTKTRIPDELVPRNPDTGESIAPNPFDNRFITISTSGAENANNEIKTETPTIQCDAYLQTYITALDLCLQGVISPSTLGIDVKKLDNAEAQREKEKTTLYTRKSYVELVEKVLPQLVKAALNADAEIHEKPIFADSIEVSVKFGEYANPSFESQVETVGKARQNGVMSIETSVDELYGDSKDDDWKAIEVKRIKEEQGITTVKETSEIDDIDVEVS